MDKQLEKFEFLNKLFYEVGNQSCDFELQILEQEGKRSKRKKFSQVCFDLENKSNKWFVGKCNQRQILPIEIVLDLEEKDKLKPIIKELQDLKVRFYVFSTGSRGYHIHIFFNREISEAEKLKIIKHFGADPQLSSNRHMVALEFAPHWKSGKIKDLIDIKEYENGN